MQLPYVLLLSSFASLAIADCAILTGNWHKFGDGSTSASTDFKNKMVPVCDRIKGILDAPCYQATGATLRVVCKAVDKTVVLKSGDVSGIHYDIKVNNDCAPLKGAPECISY